MDAYVGVCTHVGVHLYGCAFKCVCVRASAGAPTGVCTGGCMV